MMYKAFGLDIHSDIALPALPFSDAQVADVTIMKTDISKEGLLSPHVVRASGQTAPDRLWFSVPGIARFYVSDGKYVCYDPYENANEESIVLYLLGTCVGGLMHQRHRLVIHGNAVRFGDQCVIFSGVSGNGKSTLAASFHKRGYQLLADDLAVLDDRGCVQPSFPQIKIWQDTAEKLEIDTAGLRKIRPNICKYAYPLNQDEFCNTPLPVKAVYILSTHNQESIEFSPILGADKFVPLRNQTYRSGHIEGLGLKAQHLKLCSQLANSVPVARITRPKKGCDLDTLVSLIESDLGRHECAA